MTLRAQTMERELAMFSDATASSFIGSPTTRARARQKWAHAFRIYVSEVTDQIAAAALQPPRASIHALFADAAEARFLARLRLEPGLSASAAADDLADAWRAGMRAFAAGVGGTLPPSTAVHAFASWTVVAPPRDIIDVRRDALDLELTALFSSPAIAALPRLRAIAAAFHRATFGVTALAASGATIAYG